MSEALKKFSDNVVAEMQTMRSEGIFVPDEALEQASDLNQICDYEDMDVDSCAQLIVSLSQL